MILLCDNLGRIKNKSKNYLLLIINNQEFSISNIDNMLEGITSNFLKTEVVVLSIENKGFHEWVIALMDGLQQLGFQNIQIKTYTD